MIVKISNSDGDYLTSYEAKRFSISKGIDISCYVKRDALPLPEGWDASHVVETDMYASLVQIFGPDGDEYRVLAIPGNIYVTNENGRTVDRF